ncbi:putative uncharacterized protein [Rhodococcus sp. AW25M09]|uniref:hypothetical protein n=1 Tax=Rhodococcus sp. AW25M09 TaxID=1268303 RepID=UPI0002ABA94D|nr:hypothetical protein [Rhodococcus sp. AW25M09]CCQ17529.1 putative uncharacterized protein [Rhodococcus sp. AW25M09]
MDTARLSITDGTYFLTGAGNIDIAMSAAGGLCEPSERGLALRSSTREVEVSVDVLFRPRPNRLAEGWTVLAFGKFDVSSPLQLENAEGLVFAGFGSLSQIILPSELTFRLFRPTVDDGSERYLLELMPFMKVSGQPSGRDEAIATAQSASSAGDVFWSVGCSVPGGGRHVSANGAARSRQAAMGEVIDAGRILLRSVYSEPDSAPATGMSVGFGFESARVHGFDDPALDDGDLAARIESALHDEAETESEIRDKTVPPADRPGVQYDTVASSVPEQWSRIASWLRLPREPAQQKNSDSAAWPPELIELADGIDTLPENYRLSLLPMLELFDRERMRSEQAMMVEIWASVAEEEGVENVPSAEAGVSAWTFIPEFIPIAGLDGSFLVVDTRPGELHGCVTMFDKVDSDAAGPQWNSISAMLSDLASSFDTGAPFEGSWRPALVDGVIEWT